MLDEDENWEEQEFFFVNDSYEDKDFSDVPDTVKLDEILHRPFFVDQLINELLGVQNDSCLRVRFCRAVTEYLETTNKLEQTNKGKVIVALFIAEGSMFQVKNVPEPISAKLVRGERVRQTLGELKGTILTDLVSIEEVQQAVSKVYREIKSEE
jgi:hypothetical protein